MGDWISAVEAAQRLGVKQETLYAYVSRGLLSRRRAEDGRSSLFDPQELERLTDKGRPRRAAGTGDFVIESGLTEVADGKFRYRGMEVTKLALWRPFEEVAGWLWSGVLGKDGTTPQWHATPEAVAAGTGAQAALPECTLPLERLRVIVPAIAATDPLRLHLDPPAVISAGRSIIAGMVECLPVPGAPAVTVRPVVQEPIGAVAEEEEPDQAAPDGSAAGLAQAARALQRGVPGGKLAQRTADARTTQGSSRAQGSRTAKGSKAAQGRPLIAVPLAEGGIVGRFWYKICPKRPDPGLLGALRAAMALLADHELSASTFAARMAASVRADPYAVVATGLGALGGALHGCPQGARYGGASLAAESMLAKAREPADAVRVVGDLLRRGERIPGLGDFRYSAGDPRAKALLDLIGKAAPRSARFAVADAVLEETRRRSLPEPNVDFALATLVSVAGMIPGAGEAIFAVARTAGWIAHAMEEYTKNTPLLPRTVYTGPSTAPAPVTSPRPRA